MRWFAAVATLAVLAMFAVRCFAPFTRGTFGATTSVAAPEHVRIDGAQSGSPLTTAGIRAGDVIRLDRMSVPARLGFAFPTSRVPVDFTVERAGRTFSVRVTPSALAPSARLDFTTLTTFLFIVLYLTIALLVVWKGGRSREAELIVAFLFALALTGGLMKLPFVLPSPTAKFTSTLVAQLFIGVILAVEFLFPAIFPPRNTAARRGILAAGIPIAALAIAANLLQVFEYPFPGLAPIVDPLTYASSILLSAMVVLAVVEGTRDAGPEYRVRSIAAGSTLVLLAIIIGVASVLALMKWQAEWLSDIIWLQYAAGIGMTYAVLRHRLVDLHLVISRAAIFSVVSLCLIGLFVVAEWAFAVILERAIGPNFGPQSRTALAAVVALCVGLSARSIHKRVEHRLNRVFFARRYRGLAEIHRLSLETDAASDAGALVNLTLACLRRNLDAEYATMYAGRPETGYLALCNDVPGAPLHMDQDEELVLRLRRWGDSFVADIPEHVFAGALICPMVLRGTLYGFVICGPKRDRASYLRDEQETILALVLRVGIAYEWLTREAPIVKRTIPRPISVPDAG